MENIKFLKELQEELRSQPNDGQAGPRYWGIRDYKWVKSSDDNFDRISIFFEDAWDCTPLEEYVDDIINLESGEEFTENQIEELKALGYEESVLDWIHEHDTENCYLIYETRVPAILESRMFLTKAEAKKHIELNNYHYTDDVHTYAMTAWRAPKVEKLLDILENFDWGKVDIKM